MIICSIRHYWYSAMQLVFNKDEDNEAKSDLQRHMAVFYVKSHHTPCTQIGKSLQKATNTLGCSFPIIRTRGLDHTTFQAKSIGMLKEMHQTVPELEALAFLLRKNLIALSSLQ